MRIVVDEMPSSSDECPYSVFRSNHYGDEWHNCIKGTMMCPGIDECPFYMGLKNVITTSNRKAVSYFTRLLLKQSVIDKSVIRRISEQLIEDGDDIK